MAVALRFEPGPGDEHTGPSTMVSLVIIDKGGEKRVEVLSTEPGVCQHTYPRPLELARVRCGWLDESSILLVIRDDDTLVVRRGDSPREPTQELTRVTLPKNAHVTPIRPDTIPVQTEP